MEDKIRETHREELMISIEEFDALEDGRRAHMSLQGNINGRKKKC